MPFLPTSIDPNVRTVAEHDSDHEVLHADNNVIAAKGDIPIGSGSFTWSKIPVSGVDGRVLTEDSSQATGVAWAAAGGSGIPETLLDVKGDLIVASAADTAARLAVGADNTILMADSAEATGVKWGTPNGSLLAVTSYDPVSLATYTTTSGTSSDADATNLAATFTVPTSGNVLVRLTALGQVSAGSGAMFWQVRESTSVVSGDQQVCNATTAQNASRTTALRITGLTPGDSKTYKWGFHRDGTATGVFYAGGVAGPAVIEIWASP